MTGRLSVYHGPPLVDYTNHHWLTFFILQHDSISVRMWNRDSAHPYSFQHLDGGRCTKPFHPSSRPFLPGEGREERGVVSFHDAPYAIIIPADDRVRMGRESSHAWHVLHTLPSLMSQHKSTTLHLKSVFLVMNVTHSFHFVGRNSIGVYWMASYID